MFQAAGVGNRKASLGEMKAGSFSDVVHPCEAYSHKTETSQLSHATLAQEYSALRVQGGGDGRAPPDLGS